MAISPFAKFAPPDTQEINLPKAASLLGGAGATGSKNPAVLAMQQIMGYGEGPGSIPSGLRDLGDAVRRGELNDIPQGYSSIQTAATQVLEEAPTFDLAMMTGMPQLEAMAVANQGLKQGLQAAAQPKAQPEPQKAAQVFNDILVSTGTETAVESLPNVFNPDPNLSAVIKESLGSKVATDVVKQVKQFTSPDEVLPPDDADISIHSLHAAAKEWTDLIWGDARGWLSANITNVLEGLDIDYPEGEAWWDALSEDMQGRLTDEVRRSVAIFKARPAQPGPDEPGGIGGPPDVADDDGAEDEIAAQFGPEFIPDMPPLSAYTKWIDNGIPLHKNIYESLGLNSLPADLRYRKHVKQALDLRFPTTLGAWYLGGLFEDQPSVTTEEDPVKALYRNDADRFVDFVLRGDSPFQVSLNPADTRDMFKEFVFASRASRTTYAKITSEPGSYSSDFEERFELVNPSATDYDIKTERAILKAQAGWTGIGERGRLRERALDNLQAIYTRKRFIDPTYTEGFIAFASSIKGSPWYVAG